MKMKQAICQLQVGVYIGWSDVMSHNFSGKFQSIGSLRLVIKKISVTNCQQIFKMHFLYSCSLSGIV